MREALFNLVGARADLDGLAVLDLFAGSGALGLEALSRGAAAATLVERHGPTLAVARANAAALGPSARSRPSAPTCSSFCAARRRAAPFGLAFADPPYDLAEIPALPALVRPHLDADALFVLEHDTRHDFADAPGLVVARAYGQTVVSIFAPTRGTPDAPCPCASPSTPAPSTPSRSATSTCSSARCAVFDRVEVTVAVNASKHDALLGRRSASRSCARASPAWTGPTA